MGQYEILHASQAVSEPIIERVSTALVLKEKDTTIDIPLSLNRTLRNLIDQDMIVEIEAITMGEFDVRVLINLNALDERVVF